LIVVGAGCVRLDELRAYLARPQERPEPIDIEARARDILRSTRKAAAR